MESDHIYSLEKRVKVFTLGGAGYGQAQQVYYVLNGKYYRTSQKQLDLIQRMSSKDFSSVKFR